MVGVNKSGLVGKFTSYSVNVFLYFFLLHFIQRCGQLVLNIDLHIPQLLSLSSLLFFLFYAINKKKELMDCIVILYLFYMLLNGIFFKYYGSYHSTLVYYAFTGQFCFTLFYFMGRYSAYSIVSVLDKMKIPLLVSMFIGIYCFLYSPGWYMAMKIGQLNEFGSNYMEIMRLSSIWGHPYHLSYATLLYSIYLMYRLFYGNMIEKKYYAMLLLCFIILFLCQLRVCIMFFVFAFFLFAILNPNKRKNKKNISIALTAIFLVLTVQITTSKLSGEHINYIEEHMLNLFDDEHLDTRFEHTRGDIISYTFWGEGWGKYGDNARAINKWAIFDNEYQHHIAELGYFGLGILLLVLVYALVRGFRYRKVVFVEFLLICFYAIAMFGASVLIHASQYGYVFWFCVGRVVSASGSSCKILNRNESSTHRVRIGQSNA